MEELEDPGTPTLDPIDEPQGNDDPGDPLQADIEEEHSPNPGIADPTGDVDVLEDGAPDEQPKPDNDPAMDIDPDLDDDDSELDELDEAQFDDFDADAANITVPVAIDETNVGLLGVHKRKRTEEEERERKKKKKEGRRERISKKSKRSEGDDLGDGGAGARGRRAAAGRAARRAKTPEDEETLTPEERRRRALERKMDESLKTTKQSRRRQQGESVQDLGEADLETMRVRMAQAAQKDSDARKAGEPASHKLILLPRVVELLNRNTLKNSIVDPDINILEAVRFFLEPADQDAALPNYQIQREMFKVLESLQMTKEALIASEIGKVIMFYTKSNQPQPAIKRQAERLLQQWMSIVLNKKRSSKTQKFEQREYDPVEAAQRAAANGPSQVDRAAEKRRKALHVAAPNERARIEGGLATYTIAPVNTLRTGTGANRRIGGGGEEIFKRLQAKSKAQSGGVGRKN